MPACRSRPAGARSRFAPNASARAVRVLQAHQERQGRPARAMEGAPGGELVFVTATGCQLDKDTVRRAFRKVTGAAPEAALEELVTEAERRAAQLAQEAAAAETGLGDATWSFHVAGVRLTAGPGPEPWAAIGTLVTPGEDPWLGNWAQLRR